MVHQAKRWIAMLMALVMCLTLLPLSILAATLSTGQTVTSVGTGAYSITLKNDCSEAVQYDVTAGEVRQTITVDGYGELTLKGDAGEQYSVTWQGGANLTAPAQTVKSGIFGQAATGYDGFDGADGKSYTAAEVSNAALHCNHYNYDWTPSFYYVTSSVIPFYSTGSNAISGYTYYRESDNNNYGGRFNDRQSAREKALADNGVPAPYDSSRYTNVEDGDVCAMWIYWKATPYISFTAYTATTYTLSLVNNCAAPVQYDVTIGEDTQTVTLGANETREFEAAQGTDYIIEWVGGTNSSFSYIAPIVKEYTGQFGIHTQTVYYLDGQEYTGQVSDTLTYGGYTMSAGTLYAVDTLETFTRTKNGTRYVYTNTEDSGESYSDYSASGARDNIQKSYPGYRLQADSDDLGYAWVFKTVTSDEVTSTGNSTVTVTTTAVSAGQTGTFTVAALNVDGMPQTVNIADVYDLKLNDDGPGSTGSTAIGQYIQTSGIDILALSEDFNFYNEINAAAPSYATMTQRDSIPDSVGIGSLNNSLFPFDTDGLNLMYKNNLTVTSESMTAWTDHYSPTTNYVVVQVPDKNGADGMINKGFRFYQVQMAPGVVLDVYILHMDAETDPGDNAARASQIDQLMTAVDNNHNGNPIIIMGDTNCRYTRDPLQEKIIGAGFSDPWIDLERDGVYPKVGENAIMVDKEGYQKGEVVDKVFYRNVEGSPLQIEATNYRVDATGYTDDGGLLGDHPPVIVTFDYSFTSNSVAHTHDWSESWSTDAGHHWHECDAEGCTVTMNSLKDSYGEHNFGEFTVTRPATCSVPGTKTRTCNTCGYEETQNIPTTPHQFDNGVITKVPTKEEPGKLTYTCQVCQYESVVSIPYSETRNYTFEVKLDKTDYNVGDTVTAEVYVKSNDQGANFGTVGFKLNIPQGLTFENITSALTGGTLSTNVGNYAYNVNSKTPVTVTSAGVKIATVTLTVDSFNDDTSTANLSLSDCEVTEINLQTGAASTHDDATAKLHNLKVTLNPGNATIDGGTTAVTLYAKYGESGLYRDEARTQKVESINLAANEGYRLADTQWSNGMTNFAAIAGQTFTASQSYTAQTVKTWTVTFAASNVTFAADAQTKVIVDDGTTFDKVTKPGYTVNDHYTFLGWYNNDTEMAPGAVIDHDITITAKAVAATFNFNKDSDHANVNVTGGVTDNSKATYGTPITFTVSPDNSYVIHDVTYTVGSTSTTLTAGTDGTYTIPGTAITGDVSVNVTTVQYHKITFQAGEGTTMATATAYVKHGETTLYTNTDFETTFTVPSPIKQDGYRLAKDNSDEPLWSGSNERNYTTEELKTATFTEDVTLTAQAVKTWTVTFEPSNVTFTQGAQTTVTVDDGATFGSITKPGYTVNEHYTFAGWYNGDTKMEDTTPIKDSITITAKAVAATFNFNKDSENATVTVTSGLTTDNQATYGTDIRFTVSPDSSYVIHDVTYTVGEDTAAHTLTAVNGVYTIPGNDITDIITVEVNVTKYHTITFQAGTGVNMATATAYVKDGEVALYTDNSFNTPFTLPTPVAQTGYRLAADTAAEPRWSDGANNKYQTSALGSTVHFNTNTTLTALAVKTYNVTFAAGTNGSFAEDAVTKLTVDTGTVLTAAQIPAVTASTGYTFTGWDKDVYTAINADTTFTAQYNEATYTLTLPSVNGVSFEVDGAAENDDGTYTVTYGTDVTITMTATDSHVTGVSYTIGDGSAVPVENFNQPFTISGSSITGAITLTVQAKDTYQITVTVEGGNGTVNGKTSDTLTFDYGTLAADVAKAFNIVANTGYEFKTPAFTAVDGDTTYTVEFTPIEYEITVIWDDDDHGFDYKHPTEDANCAEDLDFTPNLSGQDSTEMVFEVWYHVGALTDADGALVGDGDWEDLTDEDDAALIEEGWTEIYPNDEGKFVIPRSAITGPVTIYYDTIDGSFELVDQETYKAAPAGEQMAVLNTAKRASGTYTLDGYGDMYWSSKYNAYVCFVDEDETVKTLTWKLDENTNKVTEINYTGDTNNSGSVTPADSASINAVLHNVPISNPISDLTRFQFDVTGDKAVTTRDIMWILNTFTGASNN